MEWRQESQWQTLASSGSAEGETEVVNVWALQRHSAVMAMVFDWRSMVLAQWFEV